MKKFIKNFALGVGCFIGALAGFAALVYSGYLIAGGPGAAAGVFAFGAIGMGTIFAVGRG